MRQSLQYVAQPRIRLLPVDLFGLDQAVGLCTGRRPLGRVAEQPSLAPNTAPPAAAEQAGDIDIENKA